jgi:hypothetical protein
MKRIEFIMWAAKQGWKHGQTYLNKAWDLFSKSGNIPKPTQILNKAKDLHKRTTTKPTVVKPENLNAANTTRFVEGAKKGNFKGWTPRVIKGGKKADGGRIDKALPTRSRDI